MTQEKHICFLAQQKTKPNKSSNLTGDSAPFPDTVLAARHNNTLCLIIKEIALMEAATIELIQTIATDAIKILGPAIIAAFATYKATQSQFEIKLRELEKAHEFGAREHLFKYYQDRQVQLSKDYEKLNQSLGNTLGYATGYVAGAEEEQSEFLSMLAEYVEMYSKITPTEIDTTARDMEQNGLMETEDYRKLVAYVEPLRNLDKGKTLQALRKNIFAIVDAYHFLQHCNQTLLQKQMAKIFTKYIEA